MVLYLCGNTDMASCGDDFAYAEQEVRDAGHTPINPFKFHGSIHGLTQEQSMEIDMALLDMADGMILMSGWDHSMSCNRQYGFALAKNLKIVALESLPSRYE